VAAMVGRLFSNEPLFSIILPVCNTAADVLDETLLSVKNQLASNWELCLIDDASENTDTQRVIQLALADESFRGRLHYARRKRRGGIARTLNDAVAHARLPYLVFLDHDDLLHEEALLRLVLAIKAERHYSLLYTDSRTIDLAGVPLHTYHKPDWSPESLLSGNYVNHLTVLRRDVFKNIGGFRKNYEGSQDLDLLLRLSSVLSEDDVRHIGVPLYDWRATEESVAYSGTAKPYAFESARLAVADHLRRHRFREVSVKNNPDGPGLLCNWRTGNKEIEVILTAGSNVAALKTCMEGLLQATDYTMLSVAIVCHNADLPEMTAYLHTFRDKKRVRIIRDNGPFNRAALNNAAVSGSAASVLLFMSSECEITDRDWLTNMSKYLAIKGVGVVGATLMYPNRTLWHNGMMTDEASVASNITTWGQKGELTFTRNVSAVSGACMMMERTTFLATGGFDEAFPFWYSDVDFCLSIRSLGLRIVQATDVRLIWRSLSGRGVHDHPLQLGEQDSFAALMKKKWGELLREKYHGGYEIFAHFAKIMHVR